MARRRRRAPHRGLLWSEAVAAEVVVFFAIGRPLLDRRGANGAAMLAAAAGVVRWALSAEATALPALALSQLLHELIVALLHLACIRRLAEIVPPRPSATALTLYGTVGIGAASAALTLASGALYGAVGAGGLGSWPGSAPPPCPSRGGCNRLFARNRPKAVVVR